MQHQACGNTRANLDVINLRATLATAHSYILVLKMVLHDGYLQLQFFGREPGQLTP